MKNNLSKECVKGEILSFQGKIGTIASDFLGKMTVFPVLTQLCHLSLPLNLAFPATQKLYF